ncbi:MAG: hypothetical protein HDT39_07455 [Lachnospiraceae bacterium]|nr:hypothetical protein [Lachnospiraceae bacterium]
MVNEDKVKLMTHLALYEQKESKSIKMAKYFRDDYIGLNMLNTAILITVCYVFILLLGIIYRIDYLMNNITEIDIWGIGRKLVIIYIALLVIYMLLAYIVYSVKFRVAQESNKSYSEDLKKLCRMYKREKRESKIGGNGSDDETFGF